MTALSHPLLRVRWGYYVTLTFGARWNDKRSRNKWERVHTFLRKVAKHHRKSEKLSNWSWLIAEEFGESGGRYHLHLLLADLGKPSRGHCYAMAHLWRETLGGGWAVIRPFDPSLGGVGYVLKTISPKDCRRISREVLEDSGLEGSDASGKVLESVNTASLNGRWNVNDANAYEVGKIGKVESSCGAATVTLSDHLCKVLQGGLTKQGRSLLRRGISDKYRPWIRERH